VTEVRLDHVQIAAPAGCEAAARLEAAGAPVIWDDALLGERRFYSEDPWGNRIEFLAAVG
jgi:hypothetical protein